MRSQLTGGLIVFFCRYAAPGETRRRTNEISNLETTEKFSVWTKIRFIYAQLLKTIQQDISVDTKNRKIIDEIPAPSTVRCLTSGYVTCSKKNRILFKADLILASVTF